MKSFCPNCESDRDVKTVQSQETHNVRGCEIPLDVEYLVCEDCGADFDMMGTEDPLERAYSKYRQQFGMIQPETVRAFRKKYGLTQHELARLLGWGLATLSRYENGALQDEAHDRALQMALEPHNLLQLIEKHSEAISEDKRKVIEEIVHSEDSFEDKMLSAIESRFSWFMPSVDNGFRKFISEKFFNAVLYFCKSEAELSKTKLNKLLWYADFSHYKEHTVSITGARYAHCTHGPAPDWFETLLSYMLDASGDLVRKEVHGMGFSWQALIAASDPDMNVFDPNELKALVQTQAFFKDFNATKIREFSHEEEAYNSTQDGEIISYEFAHRLQV